MASHAETYNSGVNSLAKRGAVTGNIIIAAIVTFSLTFVGEVLELIGVIDLAALDPDPLTLAYTFVLLAHTAIFFVSVVAVSMWIYRAHANLHESGIEDLNFSPGWAVGWYFIPIANLFKPFQAMRELWTESHSVSDSYAAEAPGNLGLWWGTWIIGNIVANVSMRMTLMGDGSNMQVAIGLGAISSVFLIVSAWQLLQIVRDVTAAQVGGLNLQQVFE